MSEQENVEWMPNGAYCGTCDRGGHYCPGCGQDVEHGTHACADCSTPLERREPHVTPDGGHY